MIRSLAAVACAACAALAQDAAPPPQPQAGSNGPEFEVASVKPSVPSGRGSCPGVLVGSRFSCTGATLEPLVRYAYGVSADLFKGLPGLDRDRYDIEARAPQGVGNDQLKPMLQNLLVERFGLAVHWETREMPIYELVVAKGGPKLWTPEKPHADSDGASPSAAGVAPRAVPNKDGLLEFPPGSPALLVTRANGAQWLTARMKSIADLLTAMGPTIGRPVVDKTGLTGAWDFNLRFSVPPVSNAGSAAFADQPSAGLDAPADSAPNILGAFETQLGLKLEPTKGLVKVLVVDRVNRVPTEN